MASLKEVKNRIKSVSSTRKITSAMKLVASSKLHRAQAAIESMLPYDKQLGDIMSQFMGEMKGEYTSPFAVQRDKHRVIIVAYASNSSLCGAFNANVIKEMTKTIDELRKQGVKDIEVLPIGTKIAEKARKLGFNFDTDYADLMDKPNFAQASQIAATLMQRFLDKEIDQVILIYNHFASTSHQVLTREDFLPIDLDAAAKQRPDTGKVLDYIIEPSKEELIASLIPKVLHLKIYTALLDSCASEHSARVIAMQTATDNADDLLQQLTLMYNKTRQAAITSEILDLVSGSLQ
ncbi:MAG: F0F1 ATP synthase subunit gamma [Prevotellaceae bacterium]|nr:F0F1 ATP synthase subunit gamma [Prevotellaceae bacterium]MDY3855541.1 F0F1 ATP synthase subunit gamma [Bacteroidaceae bacterium]